MTCEHVLGIDPGLTGALCWLRGGVPYQIVDMPTMKTGSKGKHEVDHLEVARLIDAHPTDITVVEHVTASTQMGVTSSFNFGLSLGIVLGAATNSLSKLYYPRPAVWKRKLKFRAGATKDDSREMCRRTWPELAGWWGRVHDDGRADAALLGLYGTYRLRASTLGDVWGDNG